MNCNKIIDFMNKRKGELDFSDNCKTIYFSLKSNHFIKLRSEIMKLEDLINVCFVKDFWIHGNLDPYDDIYKFEIKKYKKRFLK